MKDLDENKRLKIATIFSFVSSDEENEENIESVENLPKTSRDFLESAIRDYNEMFGNNFSTREFARYYCVFRDKRLD